MRQDEAWAIVGKCGRFQLFCFSLFCISKFFVGIQICSPVIVEINKQTAITAFGNATNLDLSVTLEYDPPKTEVELTKSIFWVGVMIGNSILGSYADIYGRKPLYIGSYLANIILAVLSSFAPSFLLYSFSRFLIGIAQGGMFCVVFTFANEFFPKEYWAISGGVINGMWGFGIALCSYLGYVLQNWRHYLILTSVPFLFNVLLVYMFVPESPRWLCSVNQLEAAAANLRKIAKLNGKSNYNDIQEIEREEVSSPKKKKSSAIWKALKVREYKTILRCAMVTWFVCGITAYYLTYSADHLGGTVYMNLAFQGIVEFPVDVLVAVLFGTFKRKSMFILLWIFVVFLLSSLVIGPILSDTLADPKSIAKLALAITTKSSIGAVFGGMWIYTGEIFPTIVRSSSTGLCSMSARIGAMLSPLLFELGDKIPLYLLTVAAAFVGFYSYRLPETFQKPGCDTLEEFRQQVGKGEEIKPEKVKLLEDASDEPGDEDYEVRTHAWV